jgi:hypothetical protein
MRLIDFIGNAANRKRLWALLYVVLGLVVLADGLFRLILGPEVVEFSWAGIVGFGAVYGFISCVLIIVVSKALGHLGLMKGEDYYD